MIADLTGRRAIVLGGARGIGAGVVSALVGAGAKVMLADLLVEEAHAVADQFDGKVQVQRCDITGKADILALIAATVGAFGGVDILVQVAGIYPDTLVEDIEEAEWDRVMAVNVKGAFLGIQACFPHFKAQNWGRVVLTGSITGPHVAWPGHAHYAASKAALVGLCRSVALEGAVHGITCNVIEPGNVETENLRRERGQGHLDRMAAAVPMKRLATPRELGEIVCFYCSDSAAYVTGTTLVIDGGQILPEAPL